MKKRIYRATKVKQLNLEQLLKKTQGHELVLGVDVAKEDFVAVLMNKQREVIITISWKHPNETFLFLETVLGQLSTSAITVAMEPSGTYGDSLRAQFFRNGIEVYRVSPKRCHDAAEIYDGVPSMHDAKAAMIICRLHLDGLSKKWSLHDDTQRTLRAIIKTLEMYDCSYHRNINRLEGLVMRYWPELTQSLDLQSATLLELLIEFGDPQSVAHAHKRAKMLMRKTGSNFLEESKIESVIASSFCSLGVKCIDAERDQLKLLCKEIRRLQKARQRTKLKIEKFVMNLSAVREMAPVIGKITSAVLYVILGKMSHYENAGSVVKTLGLNLREHSSGKHKGQLRITKRGSGVARKYLYYAVLRLIQKDRIVQAWYRKKVARDGQVKQKALVAITRKLAAALWHVGRGAKFDSAKLFDVSRLSFKA